MKVRVHDAGAARVLTLTYPERKNAIGPQMVGELLAHLKEAFEAPAVRAIVLTGEGQVFSAGGDFGQMSGQAPAQETSISGDYCDLLHVLCTSPKPIIAKVNGLAMGGGLGLVACATFAIGSESAVLGTPEINVGLFPMMIMAVLARIVPQRVLLKMMLLGDKMSAQEGKHAGLLTDVVPDDELNTAVAALVAKLALKSPTAMKMGLSAFTMQRDMELGAALPQLRDRLFELLGTDDAREGLTAFLEKRKPNWTGS